jgi:hypothetical protein
VHVSVGRVYILCELDHWGLRGDEQSGLSFDFQVPFTFAYCFVCLIVGFPIVGTTDVVEIGVHAFNSVPDPLNGSFECRVF